MKATGVVRRIDDLGRIVVPKEIRKTMHIKEGDPVEIYTDREGEIILKKYSPIGELSEFANNYAETLSKTTGYIACITDKDNVIAVSGGQKKDLLEQPLSQNLEEILENRQMYSNINTGNKAVPIVKNDANTKSYQSQVICPIVAEGDVIGSVVLIGKEGNAKMGDAENKVVQATSGYLGGHIENTY
jgi:AbrB family transcriptional regulator (stage V sporulation protein T)